jgi:hypothetical protein
VWRKYVVVSFLFFGLLAGSAGAQQIVSLEEKFRGSIQPCGSGSDISIDDRIRDCAAKNSTTAKDVVALLPELEKRHWALVMKPEDIKDKSGKILKATDPFFRDENKDTGREGILWSPASDTLIPFADPAKPDEAGKLVADYCAKLAAFGLVWRVPTKEEYSNVRPGEPTGAEQHKIREVMNFYDPSPKGFYYWTSSGKCFSGFDGQISGPGRDFPRNIRCVTP